MAKLIAYKIINGEIDDFFEINRSQKEELLEEAKNEKYSYIFMPLKGKIEHK